MSPPERRVPITPHAADEPRRFTRRLKPRRDWLLSGAPAYPSFPARMPFPPRNEPLARFRRGRGVWAGTPGHRARSIARWRGTVGPQRLNRAVQRPTTAPSRCVRRSGGGGRPVRVGRLGKPRNPACRGGWEAFQVGPSLPAQARHVHRTDVPGHHLEALGSSLANSTRSANASRRSAVSGSGIEPNS